MIREILDEYWLGKIDTKPLTREEIQTELLSALLKEVLGCLPKERQATPLPKMIEKKLAEKIAPNYAYNQAITNTRQAIKELFGKEEK